MSTTIQFYSWMNHLIIRLLQLTFVGISHRYMELRRRAEERTGEQRRAEAVAKLEQLLDSDDGHIDK